MRRAPGRGDRQVVLSTVSSGRIECVRRLLDSLEAVDAPVQIVLDAPDPSPATGSIREFAHQHTRWTNRPVEVYSLDDRRRLAAELAGDPRLARIPAEVIEFALLGDRSLPPAVGAARNCEYLLGGNRIVVSLDDDVVARGVRLAKRPRRNLEILPGVRDLECRFYPNRDSLLGETTLESIDVAAEARRLLGRRARDSGRPDDRPDMAVFGTAGDGGIGHRHFVFSGQVAISASDACDWRDSPSVFEGRELLRVARRYFLTPHPFYMTGAAALRGDALLPPFFPNGMPEDALFGAMLSRLYDDSLKAHAPVALYHDAPSEDHLSVTPAGEMSFSLCRILRILLLQFAPSAGSRATRLRAFGAWLRSRTEADHGEFRGWIEKAVLDSLSGYALLVDRRIEKLELPESRLGVALRDLRRHLAGRTADRRVLPLRDFAERGLDAASQFAEMQRLYRLYAEVLQSWDEIVVTARGSATVAPAPRASTEWRARPGRALPGTRRALPE